MLPGIKKKKKKFDRGNTSIGLDTGAVEAMGKNEASAEGIDSIETEILENMHV